VGAPLSLACNLHFIIFAHSSLCLSRHHITNHHCTQYLVPFATLSTMRFLQSSIRLTAALLTSRFRPATQGVRRALNHSLRFVTNNVQQPSNGALTTIVAHNRTVDEEIANDCTLDELEATCLKSNRQRWATLYDSLDSIDADSVKHRKEELARIFCDIEIELQGFYDETVALFESLEAEKQHDEEKVEKSMLQCREFLVGSPLLQPPYRLSNLSTECSFGRKD